MASDELLWVLYGDRMASAKQRRPLPLKNLATADKPKLPESTPETQR